MTASIPLGEDNPTNSRSATEAAINILLVEDDTDIAALLRVHLEDSGAQVTHVSDGGEGLSQALNGQWDLLVLDLTLPGLDGIDIAKALKQQKPMLPIIVITARTSEVERVFGLDAGADDYVTKPFSMLELVARVRAVVRRSTTVRLSAQQKKLKIGDIMLDFDRHSALVSDTLIELTAREFGLLAVFAKYPGKVFSRADLLEKVWGSSYEGYRHTVNTHINRLRAKLEPDPGHPTYIRTVWGVGYKLEI